MAKEITPFSGSINSYSHLKVITFPPPLRGLMRIMYWNVRGASRSSLRNHLKTPITEHKPDILIMTETRTKEENASRMISRLSRIFFKHNPMHGNGLAGEPKCSEYLHYENN